MRLFATVALLASLGSGKENSGVVQSDCGGGVNVLRVAAWPGGGVEVVLGLGWEMTSINHTSMPTVVVDGKPATLSPAVTQAGITGFLLVPSADANLRIALQASVERLPETEQVGLWMLNGAEIELVADLTSSKQHIISRLQQLSVVVNAAAARSKYGEGATLAVAKVVHALQKADPAGDAFSRNLVIVAEHTFAIGNAAPGGFVDASPTSVSSILWLSAHDGTLFNAASNTIGWGDAQDVRAVISAGSSLADVIALRRAKVVRAGVCLPARRTTGGKLLLQATSAHLLASAICHMAEPSAHAVEDVSWTCNAESIALGVYPWADNVTIVLDTNAEEAVFNRNAAFLDGNDEQAADAKSAMNATVALGNNQPMKASLHFHGFSSFRTCARKSMTVHLHGERELAIQPRSTGDTFVLISMCEDNRYVKTELVESLFTAIGTFSFPKHYVAVTVRHANSTRQELGLFLLMADSSLVFKQSTTHLAAVVRRRNDPDRATDPAKGAPDVKVFGSADDSAAVLAAYDDLARAGAHCDASGSSCYDVLFDLMDFDQFLRVSAGNTFVGNADTTDELFFFTSRELDRRFYWRLSAWDTDDAFEYLPSEPGNGCHHEGRDAQFDPHGMLFCSEGALDKVLIRSPDVYGRWADELEFIARSPFGLSKELIHDTALRQLATVYGLVRDDNNVADGLLELRAQNPNITDAASARTDISDALFYYLGWIETRRAGLLRQLRLYRSRMNRPPAPVPFVNGVGDYTPGVLLLSPATPPPVIPVVAPLRLLNEAPPGAPLLNACDALQSGRLQVSLATRLFSYTSALPQEILLVPHIMLAPDAGGTGVLLAGLNMSWSFDRVPLNRDSDGEPVAVAAPPDDFVVACLSGGAVPDRPGAVPAHDMCSQYSLNVTIAEDRVAVKLNSGSLCAGCVLDLGVDAGIASVWHSRWLPLPNASLVAPMSVSASCGGKDVTSRGM